VAHLTLKNADMLKDFSYPQPDKKIRAENTVFLKPVYRVEGPPHPHVQSILDLVTPRAGPGRPLTSRPTLGNLPRQR